jgi:hypothetical protein
MQFSVQMTTLLSGMEYPVRPEDLLRAAESGGVPQLEVDLLALLPDREYRGSLDVARTIVALGHDRQADAV